MEADGGDTRNLTVNKKEILQDYNLPWPKQHVPNLCTDITGKPNRAPLSETAKVGLQDVPDTPPTPALKKATGHGGVKQRCTRLR